LTTSRATGPVVGEFAPDFSLEAVDGATVRLSNEQGKPVLLYFWALWCTPCIEELSMLQTIEREDLVILTIAVREPPDKITAFVSDQALKTSVLLDPEGRQSDAFGVRGLPTSLFVDRDGVIAARQVGPIDQDALDSILDMLDASRDPATVP
jgi:peroxiredoxin